MGLETFEKFISKQVVWGKDIHFFLHCIWNSLDNNVQVKIMGYMKQSSSCQYAFLLWFWLIKLRGVFLSCVGLLQSAISILFNASFIYISICILCIMCYNKMKENQVDHDEPESVCVYSFDPHSSLIEKYCKIFDWKSLKDLWFENSKHPPLLLTINGVVTTIK